MELPGLRAITTRQRQLGPPDLVVGAVGQVAIGEDRGDGLDGYHGDHDFARRFTHPARVARNGYGGCAGITGSTGGYNTGVEFDRPVRVRLVRECDLVHAGLQALMADHADRVILVPPGPAHAQ